MRDLDNTGQLIQYKHESAKKEGQHRQPFSRVGKALGCNFATIRVNDYNIVVLVGPIDTNIPQRCSAILDSRVLIF